MKKNNHRPTDRMALALIGAALSFVAFTAVVLLWIRWMSRGI
jgi:hypothetical protein